MKFGFIEYRLRDRFGCSKVVTTYLLSITLNEFCAVKMSGLEH